MKKIQMRSYILLIKQHILQVIIVLSILLSGCAVGPEYQRPETPVAGTTTFINDANEDKSLPVMQAWWSSLQDPLLDTYIAALLTHNTDLQAAAARITQAWEQRRVETGSYYPSISISNTNSRSFNPVQSTNLTTGEINTQREYSTSIQVGLAISWQIDLFNSIKNSVAAADARLYQSQANLEALQHSLIAELIKTRINMASLQKRIALNEEIITAREKTLKTVERRYESGVADTSAADVYSARENLSSAQANVPDLQQELNAQAYTLDVLLGQLPGTTKVSMIDFDIMPPPLEIPIGLPLHLLDRRPDLRSAELAIIAANADIGIAIADLYPSISLTGNLDYQGDGFDNLLDATQLAGSLLSSITLRLFEGGKLRANIRLQEAEAEELISDYIGSILTAVQEVETALNTEKELDKQIQFLEKSVKAIRQAERLTLERYQRGIDSLLEVLDTQRRRASAEESLMLAQQAKWLARIDLYLALGGDWLNNKAIGH